MDLFDFAYFPKHLQILERLAEISQLEKWDFPKMEVPKFEILDNYIHKSFIRLLEENKIAYTEGYDRDKKPTRYACFNSGLLARETGEEIYFFFLPNIYEDRKGEWFCLGVGTPSNARFRNIAENFQNKLPPIADFIGKDYENLVMNPHAVITPNYEHFHENPNRLPPILQNMTPAMLNAFIDGALSLAKKTIRTQLSLRRTDVLRKRKKNTIIASFNAFACRRSWVRAYY